jgi:hypothetical protein
VLLLLLGEVLYSSAAKQSSSMSIQNGWFSEVEAMWPGQKFSLEVEKVRQFLKTNTTYLIMS